MTALARPACGAGDFDLGERALRKYSFSRSGTTQMKTATPSTSTIHFVPLPRLVLPTAEPPFWLERSCHPGKPRPIAAILLHPGRRAVYAKRRAKHPALPTASTAASMSRERDICRAGSAKPPQSTTPRECPPGSPGSRPRDDPDYPGGVWAQATAARSATTAHPSTVRIDACSHNQ